MKVGDMIIGAVAGYVLTSILSANGATQDSTGQPVNPDADLTGGVEKTDENTGTGNEFVGEHIGDETPKNGDVPGVGMKSLGSFFTTVGTQFNVDENPITGQKMFMQETDTKYMARTEEQVMETYNRYKDSNVSATGGWYADKDQARAAAEAATGSRAVKPMNGGWVAASAVTLSAANIL